jgi:hypothetical protein
VAILYTLRAQLAFVDGKGAVKGEAKAIPDTAGFAVRLISTGSGLYVLGEKALWRPE